MVPRRLAVPFEYRPYWEPAVVAVFVAALEAFAEVVLVLAEVYLVAVLKIIQFNLPIQAHYPQTRCGGLGLGSRRRG